MRIVWPARPDLADSSLLKTFNCSEHSDLGVELYISPPHLPRKVSVGQSRLNKNRAHRECEAGHELAVFLSPNIFRVMSCKHGPRLPQNAETPPSSRLEELFTAIVQHFGYLADTNATLRGSLHQLFEERGKSLQSLQLKDQCLQTARERIKVLQQEIKESKQIAIQMQQLQGYLEACEQQMCKLETSFETIKTEQEKITLLFAHDQKHVPELESSVNEVEVESLQRQRPSRQRIRNDELQNQWWWSRRSLLVCSTDRPKPWPWRPEKIAQFGFWQGLTAGSTHWKARWCRVHCLSSVLLALYVTAIWWLSLVGSAEIHSGFPWISMACVGVR